ncbi:magnesium protoporphyrin IX methyltransferase [Pseudoponticoccus marisrubri]|uniref:Magnesium protoporphyrin IX methyltransferase n=1 Tax=Pseudoponticoccus marisrubri TaxID=1685382 RepID=A0A0W7WHG2_9RHOB|nr:magnesium protoporphyrin IX methyltransferase [Pseudoponticoccus marisrubri]KUF10033.1 magnesium protoporphyrin O-methyltransferase [Pseudoponticoccus marisrubri]
MGGRLSSAPAGYEATRARVETYFDQTATQVWARLTSDAPVSKIRQTVRAGRDAMRARLLERLPADLAGARVLDAGCGTGLATAELAVRGAEVVAVDISPALIEIARDRLAPELAARVQFEAGDMLMPQLGRFDAVIAMDSLIYYDATDIASALERLAARCDGPVVFTVPPRTPLLMAMWQAGRLFPRADRSPTMVPQAPRRLARRLPGKVTDLGRVTSGFYISHALEIAP